MNVKELVEMIEKNKQLYEEGRPDITDSKYDKLMKQLEEIDPNNPLLFEAGVVTFGKKVKHQSVMGSLLKCTTIPELIHWQTGKADGENDLMLMPKVDGLAIELVYEQGYLKQATTRGDGYTGVDVTHIFKVIKKVPNKLEEQFTGRIRGEAFIPKSFFEKHLRSQGLANPRNAAAGCVNNKDSQVAVDRGLSFICYDILPNDISLEYEVEKTDIAEKIGINYVPIDLVTIEDLTQEFFDHKALVRQNYEYGIDGMVIKVNNISQHDMLGWTGKCPNYGIAWKFPPVQTETMVLRIVSDMGRTGRLTPVAEIEPTLLDGSTISRISLHNYEEVERLNISPGAKILIEKAGDIIPQVVEVLEPSLDEFKIPTECPVCNSEVEKEGAYLVCQNFDCPSKVEGKILHYIKRLDLKGIGTGLVSKMVSFGLVKEIKDLYFITEEKLLKLDGLGKRSAKMAYNTIMGKTEVPLNIFLSSFGIKDLGRTTSKILANEFKTLENVLASATVEKLKSLEGIGSKTAESIQKGLLHPEVLELADIIEVIDVKTIDGKLTGKSFCITGKLSKGRKEIAADIESAGGTIKSSVSKGLDYLVVGENVGSKYQKAEKFGIEIISEEELNEMIS